MPFIGQTATPGYPAGMIRTTLLLAPAMLLAGCATAPLAAPDAAPTEAYTANGTEPFWSIVITPAQLDFSAPDRAPLRVRNPGARPSFNGERTVTARITVDITHVPCGVGMGDRRYPDTVMVEAFGQTWRGCGGAVQPNAPNSLDRSSWIITAVDGRAAVADVAANLSFNDAAFSGTAGCNRLRGSFMQTPDRLIVDQLVATRMACPGPRGAQESAVLAVLRQPMTVRFGARMTVTLTAADGHSLALRRIDWDRQ